MKLRRRLAQLETLPQFSPPSAELIADIQRWSALHDITVGLALELLRGATEGDESAIAATRQQARVLLSAIRSA